MKLEKAVQKIDYNIFHVVVVDSDYSIITDFTIEKDTVENKTIYKFPGCTYEFYADAKVKFIVPNKEHCTKNVVELVVKER